MSIEIINPSNGNFVARYAYHTNQTIQTMIAAAQQRWLSWRHSSLQQRAQHLISIATLLQKNNYHYAHLISTEMGKPILQAQAEISKCALVCQHYAQHAAAYLQKQVIQTNKLHSFICYEPLGIILSIEPWNYPFWQAFRSVIPVIAAGNVSLLKHAPNCSGSALAIEQLLLDAGLPPHVMQTLLIDNLQAAEVIAHPQIAAITFTGSVPTAQIIGRHAATHLKKLVLELGGNDPYLILADADIELAAQSTVAARISNCGQICIAPKRFIVHTKVAQPFIQAVLASVQHYRAGDPLDAATSLGPLARADLRDKLHQQIHTSITQGAQLLLGGKMPHGPGYYYPITVLSAVTRGMPAFDEELFGPVISIIIAKDDAEAIALANDTPFGLGAGVYTRDIAKGMHIAEKELQAGTCYVNGTISSDPY